jgi:hypothetical protein
MNNGELPLTGEVLVHSRLTIYPRSALKQLVPHHRANSNIISSLAEVILPELSVEFNLIPDADVSLRTNKVLRE